MWLGCVVLCGVVWLFQTPRQSVNGTRPGPSGGDKPSVASISEGGANTTTTVSASPAPKGSAAAADGKEPESISAQNDTKRQSTGSSDSKSAAGNASPSRAGTTTGSTGSPDGAAGGDKPRKSSLRDRLGNKAKARLTIVGPNALRAKTEESLTLQNLFNKELDQYVTGNSSPTAVLTALLSLRALQGSIPGRVIIPNSVLSQSVVRWQRTECSSDGRFTDRLMGRAKTVSVIACTHVVYE